MKTLRVTASEFQRSYGTFVDKALSRPVTVTKQGRDHVVLMSASEYARLKRRERRAGLAEDIPDEVLELIRTAEVDPRHAELDKEIEGWRP